MASKGSKALRTTCSVSLLLLASILLGGLREGCFHKRLLVESA